MLTNMVKVNNKQTNNTMKMKALLDWILVLMTQRPGGSRWFWSCLLSDPEQRNRTTPEAGC